MDQKTKNILRMEAILLAILIILVVLGLCSCTTTQYVPVIEHKTDTLIQTRLQRDSIYLKDSTHVSEKTKGDTVWVEMEKWHTKYVEKQVYDTIYVAKRDSIPVPYEVIKEVPRKVSKTERALMIAGILSMMAVIVFVVWKVKKFLP